jgi:hypothetical protein
MGVYATIKSFIAIIQDNLPEHLHGDPLKMYTHPTQKDVEFCAMMVNKRLVYRKRMGYSGSSTGCEGLNRNILESVNIFISDDAA